jgi:hypothetical protein
MIMKVILSARVGSPHHYFYRTCAHRRTIKRVPSGSRPAVATKVWVLFQEPESTVGSFPASEAAQYWVQGANMNRTGTPWPKWSGRDGGFRSARPGRMRAATARRVPRSAGALSFCVKSPSPKQPRIGAELGREGFDVFPGVDREL